ncbi:MAG: serine/threonine protein kinase, partial [Myxococcales bacterium]|nr:serine/threonine protein kinase [Myxococcales bacterium]
WLEAPAPHESLGRYLVLGTLGRGGMGTVLEAFDPALDRRVALKVLHGDLGQEHTQRLVREAQAMAKLSHPNVVQVYEVGSAEGRSFIAMELVRGRSLHDFIHVRPLPPWREALAVMIQAGEGLAAAHAGGLVHRDFKPSNVIIDERDRVRVLDFGLARRADDPTREDLACAAPCTDLGESSLGAAITQTGAVLGTPAYMPPEQMKGHDADARSDQFAFCVSLYEALYGERPFDGQSMAALVVSMRNGTIRPATRGTTVPAAVRRVVLRGLATEPEDRWPSMAALLLELRRLVAPRRRHGWGLGLAVGLAALGLGLAQYARRDMVCDGAEAQLRGVWDAERQQAVRDAILGTGLAHAPDTWERVQQRLDAHAEAWVAAHTEACEATRVTRQQSEAVLDLRMGCLGRQRIALREAVDVLSRGSATGVHHAVQLVAGLPDPARCEDVPALRAELPPPADPQVASRVEALRQRLSRARSLAATGELHDALTMTESVVARAEALTYPPLQAEAWLARGVVEHLQGRYAEAEADLEQAYLLAAEHRHTAVEAEATAELTFVVGAEQARPEAGQYWGKTALALARGIGPRAEARALTSIGATLSSQPEQALLHHRRALALLEQELEPEHPAIASALNNIGHALHDQGQLGAALEHHQRALSSWQRALGPRHHTVAISLANIGHVLLKQGHHASALAHYRQALAITEEALGPEHPAISGPLQYIGVTLTAMGEPAEGLAHHRRALAIRERTLGPEHPSAVLSRIQIGDGLRALGHHAQARAAYARALTTGTAALPPHHPYLSMVLGPLVDLDLQLQDHEAARRHAEQAIEVRSAGEAHSTVGLAQARLQLARALWPHPRQRAHARALAQVALDAVTTLGPDHANTQAQLEAWLAEHPAP